MPCNTQAKVGRILPMRGVCVLTLPDGSRSVITGLGGILAAMYNKNMPVDLYTARRIVKKVAMTHHIDGSARQQYCYLLLEKYRKYYDPRASAEQADEPAQFVHDDNLG